MIIVYQYPKVYSDSGLPDVFCFVLDLPVGRHLGSSHRTMYTWFARMAVRGGQLLDACNARRGYAVLIYFDSHRLSQ